MRDNLLFDLSPNGTVMISERLTIKMSCFMNYLWFPFDTQICPITLEPYAHREYQMKLHWEADPVHFNTDLQMAEFTLAQVITQKECNRTYSTGVFSCLQAYIVFERNFGYYALHVFTPSLLCVMISWASFWIKLEIAPARVTISIATFLTITQQQATISRCE